MKWIHGFFLALALAVWGCGTTPEPASEQAATGEEHPGEEHPGEEHPGEEHPGEGAQAQEGSGPDQNAQTFTAQQIKSALNSHIERTVQQGGGVFRITDETTGEPLELTFVQIHDPVRKLEGRGYFACTDFQVRGGQTVYDIDFWLNPQNGQLQVTETRIHKKDGVPRYTFHQDQIVEIP